MPSYNEHKAGNIIRIKLKNFMTYDKLELTTGPGLNMIIGPNGSGKSSIICAICLGLGGRSETTGRKLKLSEYIKHGAKVATIRIVLADPSSKSGYMKVERRISQSGPSEFRINNAPAKENDVEREMTRFNIQVNNLCQFMPQEKVVEFSKMTPKMLLESVQQTVDSSRTMNDIYKELVRSRSDILKKESDMNDRKSVLEKNKQRNDRLLPALQNYRNVVEMRENIKKLDEKREVLLYQDLLKKGKEANLEVENSKNLLDSFKEKNISSLEKKHQRVKEEIQTYNNQMESLKSDATKNKHRITDFLDEIKDIDNKIYEAKEYLRNKYDDFKRLGERKEDIQRQIAVFESNVQKYAELSKQLHQEVTAGAAETHKNNLNLTNAEQDVAEKQEEINRCGHEEKNLQIKLKNLENSEKRKEEMLQRIDKDTYSALQWLRENRHQFKKDVIGPLLLLISVPDAQNIKFLETHIANRDMTLFLCEDTEDTKNFTNILRAKCKLSVNAACASTMRPLAQYKPARPECLNKYRFTAYLKDLFEAPDIVKSFLCERYNIHNTPVGNDATEKYLNARGSSLTNEMPFQRFYTPTTSYFIRRSKYGDRLPSVNTNLIRQGGYFTSFASSSQSERMELEEQIKELDRTRQISLKEYQQLKLISKQFSDLVEQGRRKQYELMKARENLKKSAQQLDQKRLALANLEAESRNFDIRALQEECSEKITEHKNKKIVLLRKLLVCAKKWFDDTKKKCSLHFYKASCLEKKQEIEMEKEMKNSELIELEKSLEQKSKEWKAIKLASRNQCDKACQKTGVDLRTDEGKRQLREKLKDLPNTIDKIDQERMKLSSRLECIGHTDENVVDEHKKLEQQIKSDEKYLDRKTDELKTLNLNIAIKKEQWLKPLQELISRISGRFSSYFESMGCAGEICLSKGENENDFDKYGLSIQVKYRDTVPLRELSQAHHSGGECSVATMIFILSLQELVEVPFRCVDEINQGMDAINERKIFEFVAESAQNSSQYFLLTPKLLHGLPYPKKANLHVIHNGPCLEFVTWREKALTGEEDDDDDDMEQ